jgi:hypothetical protein
MIVLHDAISHRDENVRRARVAGASNNRMVACNGHVCHQIGGLVCGARSGNQFGSQFKGGWEGNCGHSFFGGGPASVPSD